VNIRLPKPLTLCPQVLIGFVNKKRMVDGQIKASNFWLVIYSSLSIFFILLYSGTRPAAFSLPSMKRAG
jgi:hypothetical protein